MVARFLLLFILISCIGVTYAKNTSNITYNVSYYQSGNKVKNQNFNLWQREVATINIDVLTPEEFSYLRFNAFLSNEYLIDYKVIEIPPINNTTVFKKQIRIYIWPLIAGKKSTDIPNIQLMLSGKVIKDIKLPVLNFNIKSLPDYLPPGFPVGKVTHNNSYQTNSIIPFITKPNELASYTLKTKTIGIHPSLIPDYSNYLKSSSITRLATSASTEIKSYDINYTYSRTQLLPIVTRSNGINVFKSFKILYFDPLTGKIDSPLYSSSLVLSLNISLQILLLIMITIFLYIIISYLLKLSNRILGRRLIWTKIYQADSSINFSLALRALQSTPHILTNSVDRNNNISIAQWAASWEDKILESEIERLMCILFSESPTIEYNLTRKKIIKRLQYLDNFIYYRAIPNYQA